MNFKSYLTLLIFFINGCVINNDGEEFYKWNKLNASTKDLIIAMKHCGYPNEREIGDKNPEEIAEIHMCMVRYGYFYKTLNGHYCADNYHLPACIEAREQGYIN